MRKVIGCVGLALALAVLPPVLADDKKADDKTAPAEKKADDKAPAKDKDKKPDDKGGTPEKKPDDKGTTTEKKPDDKAMTKKADDKRPPAKDKKEAVERLVVGGEISGKLIHWEGTQKYFTVKVSVPVADPNAIKRLADLQIQYQRQAAGRDRNGMAATAVEMAKVSMTKNEDHDIDFQAATDMKVRTLTPMVYDEKGKPRKLTAKEREELKGPDKRLPGYMAEVADIRQDSYVTVYLPKAKKGTRTSSTSVSKDDKAAADNKPEAIMLLIVGDAPPPK
jgi:hypothetical protein